MFDLDHSLAQEIADRAMAILPRNVNVMDSQGLIIGTGRLSASIPATKGLNWSSPTIGLWKSTAQLLALSEAFRKG